MKKIEKICVSAACVLALTFSTGAFIKVYAAETPVSTPGQPVDLTYALLRYSGGDARKLLNLVLRTMKPLKSV